MKVERCETQVMMPVTQPDGAVLTVTEYEFQVLREYCRDLLPHHPLFFLKQAVFSGAI